jgi:hypothetical protein
MKQNLATPCRGILGIIVASVIRTACCAPFGSAHCDIGWTPFDNITLSRTEENLNIVNVSDILKVNAGCCLKDTGLIRTVQCTTGIFLSCSSRTNSSVTASNPLLFSRLPRASSDISIIYFSLAADMSGTSYLDIALNENSGWLNVAKFTLTVQRPALTPSFILNNVAKCWESVLPCSCPLPGSPPISTDGVMLSCERGCTQQDQGGLGLFAATSATTYLRLQDNTTRQAILFLNTTDQRWLSPSPPAPRAQRDTNRGLSID